MPLINNLRNIIFESRIKDVFEENLPVYQEHVEDTFALQLGKIAVAPRYLYFWQEILSQKEIRKAFWQHLTTSNDVHIDKESGKESIVTRSKGIFGTLCGLHYHVHEFVGDLTCDIDTLAMAGEQTIYYTPQINNLILDYANGQVLMSYFNDDALKRILLHELNHIALARAAKSNLHLLSMVYSHNPETPVWLQEGFAEFMARKLANNFNLRVNKAFQPYEEEAALFSHAVEKNNIVEPCDIVRFTLSYRNVEK